MTEEWRNVPGYEGVYQISIGTKEGSLRRLYKNGKVNEISNCVGNNGYIVWKLSKDNCLVIRQAARWIALTYPELVQNEYFEGAEIDHIDTDRLNNHPSNLRWVTRKDNINNPLSREHKKQSLMVTCHSEKSVKHLEELNAKQKRENHPRYGTKHTEDAKRKMREAWERRRNRS